MGHVDLLQVPHLDEVVGERTDLRVGEHTFDQVEALDRHNLQQVCQHLPCKMIIVAVELLDASLLHLPNQCEPPFVFDFVILKLELLQRRALVHKHADLTRACIGDFVVGKNDRLQLLLLLARERVYDYLHARVGDAISG